jgi:hypothetical protein
MTYMMWGDSRETGQALQRVLAGRHHTEHWAKANVLVYHWLRSLQMCMRS